MKKLYMIWMILLIAVFALSGCNLSSEQPHSTSSEKKESNILDEMEGPPKNGHTLEKHVGKSDQELTDRVQREHVTAASSYSDKDTATKAVEEALKVHEKDIENWLQSNRDRLVLQTSHSFAVGKSVLRSDMRVHNELHNTLTVLAKDPTSERKYKIITSYPVAKRGD
ncbi:RNase A-like domain-containing lipoprotein [Priestia koreensis]|uniref:RNase A-like domain-containing lipoprotein n=1 Tax=Priestia koreensis TaxID=284581 RepID=UPI00345B463F